MPQMFTKRKPFMVYYEEHELEGLKRYARARCLNMSQWVRKITLHIAAKDGALTESSKLQAPGSKPDPTPPGARSQEPGAAR